jgi:hypothetical protein
MATISRWCKRGSDIRKGTRQDALWFALGANKSNGVRMSRADVRKAIGIALKEFAGRSNNEISKQIGCDDKTVASQRREMESASEIPKVVKATGADGKQYPTSYATSPAKFKNPEDEEDVGGWRRRWRRCWWCGAGWPWCRGRAGGAGRGVALLRGGRGGGRASRGANGGRAR